MREIDGSQGEGGGQVFRTSLALAAVTGTPVRIVNIRANRDRPGLRPQHLAALRAVAEITDGKITGAHLDATEVTFEPGRIRGGEYHFGIETAGSAILLLQSILPAMVASRENFDVRLEGGTDVPFAPGWDHFARIHLPQLAEIGFDVEATLGRRGYFPAGGGRVFLRVGPGGPAPTSFAARGRDLALDAVIHSHGLPRHIAKRATDALRDALARSGYALGGFVEDVHRGPGTGMGVTVVATGGGRRVGASVLGRKGLPAEAVGEEAGVGLARELDADVALDEHAADQLLVYLALAGGGSFTARRLTPHARTVMALVPGFLPVTIADVPDGRGVRVTVSRA